MELPGRRVLVSLLLGIGLAAGPLSVLPSLEFGAYAEYEVCLETWDPVELPNVAPERLRGGEYSFFPFGLRCEWRDRDGGPVVVEHHSWLRTVLLFAITPLSAAALLALRARRLRRARHDSRPGEGCPAAVHPFRTPCR